MMETIELDSIKDQGQKPSPKESFGNRIQNEFRKPPKPKFNKRKCAFKFLPILDWFPSYNLEKGISDLIAGVTVGLTMIPQGIAYALVANLPAQYGLYSAFMSCFVFLFLGASKDLSMGPEAVLAILTYEVSGKGIEHVILLTFISGIIIFVLAIFRLGVVIDFMSVPVNAGFTSAAAITIASSQVRGLLGLALVRKSGLIGFLGTWVDVFLNISSIRASDTVLGISCIVVLLLMRELKNVTWFSKPNEGDTPTACQTFWGKTFLKNHEPLLKKSLWLTSISSNAIVVISSAMLAFMCDPILPETNNRNTTFILTGNIEAGLPPFRLPAFGFNNTESGEYTTFLEMTSNLGSSIFVIPIISILANVAIAKSFAQGKPVDASQNMFGLGVSNILCSFVSSMPVTSSFSRSAVNQASGVKTPFGGIYTGIMVILALSFMMPYCAYIPIASLSAVIISAVIFMIDYQIVKPLWHSSKLDFFAMTVTFLSGLLWNLAYGILVGIGVQLIFVLFKVARPHAEVTEKNFNGLDYIIVRPHQSPLFPSVSYLRTLINKLGLNNGNSKSPIVVDCQHILSADFTSMRGFTGLVADFRLRNQPLIFYNITNDVADLLLGHNPDHICSTGEDLEQKLKELSELEALEETVCIEAFETSADKIVIE